MAFLCSCVHQSPVDVQAISAYHVHDKNWCLKHVNKAKRRLYSSNFCLCDIRLEGIFVWLYGSVVCVYHSSVVCFSVCAREQDQGKFMGMTCSVTPQQSCILLQDTSLFI